MDETLRNDWYATLFGVRRSIRYHIRRVRFYDMLNIWATAFSLLLGSATILAILGNLGSQWALAASALVTVLSVINLLVGSTRRAREHHDLCRQFHALEKNMIQIVTPTDENLRVMIAQRLDIESDEPPILRTLDMLCHNEQCRAEGHPRSACIPVKWYQRWCAQFCDIGADRMTTV